MLHLHSSTSARWLRQVEENLEEVLIDHAHCEKKAAACAMTLLGAYITHEELTRAMTEIVVEELDHFHQVLDLLRRRGIAFRRLTASRYAGRLHRLIRPLEPERGVDRLLVAGLIEARSCERFDLLRRNVPDPELAAFYDSLFESEARHHATYVRLAESLAPRQRVRDRLDELARAEARIVAEGDSRPRMHS